VLLNRKRPEVRENSIPFLDFNEIEIRQIGYVKQKGISYLILIKKRSKNQHEIVQGENPNSSSEDEIAYGF
tara:strand:+ start:76 stop:288 length:213 start_codon:yes stop_codon:yes gene_type:complete